MLFCIRQIVERKREAIDAFPRWVVAQLCFDFSIGIGDGGILIHPDVGLGRNGFVDIGQASTLLQDGPILTVGGLLPKGHRRGHQEALAEGPDGHPGLLVQPRLTNVLGHKGRHAGHLGGCHGGTGHHLIGLATGNGAVDRIDGTAGGRELRLQLQRAGNTPGGEVTHGVVFQIIDCAVHFAGNGERSGAVQLLAPIVRHRLGHRPNQSPVRLPNGNTGLALGVVGQIHVDGARLIVADNRSNRAIFHGGFSLLIEGRGTTGAEGDLTFQRAIQRSEILLCAKSVDENVVIGASNGCQGPVGIAPCFCIAEHPLIHLKICAGEARIVHRSNGQRIGI